MLIFCLCMDWMTRCVFQGFNGADLRNICTEAGMAAIRAERDYVIQEDFMKVYFLQLLRYHFNIAW